MIARLRPLFDQTQGNGLKARLIRGGLGSVAIQAANRLLVLTLGIVLARGLGAEGYGVYAYAFAIMSLLMVLAEAGVPALLMREVAAAQGCEAWGLMRGVLHRARQFVLLTAVTVSLIGLGVLAVFAAEMQTAVLYTTALMLLILPLAALNRIMAHAIRGLHRVVLGQAVDMLLHPLLVLTLVVIGFLLWPTLREPYYAMAAQFAGFAIVCIVTGLLLRRLMPTETRSSPAEYRERTWLKSTLPFTLIGGAGILNSQTDIIMLGWLRSTEEVGLYRVATQAAMLVAFGLQAANAVIAPQFARLHAQGDTIRLQRLVTLSARAILLLALPVAMAFVFAGGLIASWVFGAEFKAAHWPLAILAIGQLTNAFFGSVGFLLNMTGHEKDTARTLWQTGLLNVLLNAALIPAFGMTGAALASALSLFVWNLVLYQIVKTRLGIYSTAINR